MVTSQSVGSIAPLMLLPTAPSIPNSRFATVRGFLLLTSKVLQFLALNCIACFQVVN